MTTKQLFARLRKRTARNAAGIDRRIEDECLEEWTILMSDSSGFSRRTHEEGILQFLAVMIHCFDRLERTIRRHHGVVLSSGADNILAIFRRPADAAGAAVDMHRLMHRRNVGLPPRDQFSICIGIHTGPILRLADNVYGGPVNVAAKIGEDLADKDEILATRQVIERIGRRFRIEEARTTSLGGHHFELFRILH